MGDVEAVEKVLLPRNFIGEARSISASGNKKAA
jgi:hypothetical protein